MRGGSCHENGKLYPRHCRQCYPYHLVFGLAGFALRMPFIFLTTEITEGTEDRIL
ncbi:MAG: hypothetical protein QG618_456 [Thermodesulfobacteriota bacterium]|nr:hypothetical protein [Thermodesulfobacteriota bacterium]